MNFLINLIQDLLDVADVLNKAISSVPASELEESQSLKDLHQGLQLTESQLLKVLFVVCCTMLCKLICFNFVAGLFKAWVSPRESHGREV